MIWRTISILILLLTPFTAWAQDRPLDVPPILIRAHIKTQDLQVVSLTRGEVALEADVAGLVVWADGGQDAWQYLPPGSRWTVPAKRSVNSINSLLAATRGQGGDAGAMPGTQMTFQVDQLFGQGILRGSQFLTPVGPVLNPQITIRRGAEKGEELPEEVALLLRGNKVLARIPFEKGQAKVSYEQLAPLLPYPNGLPAGEYYLKMEGGADSAAFTVADPQWREDVMQLPDRLAELLNGREDPLYLQIAAEYLLDQRDEFDKPLSYFADALDILESAPEDALTTHLKKSKHRILAHLAGKKDDPVAETTTGIEEIDQIRSSILAGKWDEAAAIADSDTIPQTPRAQGLAALYRAVIYAESGVKQSASAQAAFEAALPQLQEPADLFRAHSNYASFVMNLSQDHLYNHAFQIATGGQLPLLTSLGLWQLAEQNYQSALSLCDKMSPDDKATTCVNLARVYALLADVIRTLDAPEANDRDFVIGEQAALQRAQDFLAVVDPTRVADPLVRAGTEEMRAQLAFRTGDGDLCLKSAEAALAHYLDAGSLTGAEGIHRLLGMYHARHDQTTDALTHLLVSHEIAELLRERIPADEAGLSRAGFFSRRAYINEQVIDLYVRDGKAAEALDFAELASARSLQDVLTTEKALSAEDDAFYVTTAEILASWPPGVAAVKYFIGTEKIWLFVIDTKGQVEVHDLLGQQSKSRHFVAKVRSFLTETEGQAQKMRRRLLARKGFDHLWQDELHEFFQTLMPKGVLERLRQAETVLVVPHHILHYFPFAALVTARDEQPRSNHEMVQPRFLIDEEFELSSVPSLAVWWALRERPANALKEVNAVGIVDFPSAPRLPGVETDLRNLKSAFGDQVKTVLFADEARETSVQELLEQPGMLLFATHGHNVADRPLDSYLMVMPDDQGDGSLTARELFATSIHSDLIVMSACYSGLADRSPLPGDDLFGLQRAMLQSGARTIVSGLWDVYDETGPLLMHGFFEQLATGAAAPTALANSQRAFLKEHRAEASDPWLHPYFWAVYTINGDERIRFDQ